MSNTRDQSQKVPPDAEIIARQWALSQTAITDIVGTNIATRLPRGSALPFLSVDTVLSAEPRTNRKVFFGGQIVSQDKTQIIWQRVEFTQE